MNLIDYSTYILSFKEKRDFMICASIFTFITLYLFYNTAFVLIPAVLSAFLSLRLYGDYKARKRRELLKQQFRDLLYSLSASIAGGRHMAEALSEARDNLLFLYSENTPMLKELKMITERIEGGKEKEEELLKDLGKRSGLKDIIIFADVYCISRETGGNLERMINISERIILDKLTIAREIESLTAQKRFEGRIIALMPLGIIFFLSVMSPGYLEPLYSGLMGRMIMTGALISLIYGYYAMDKITRIDL